MIRLDGPARSILSAERVALNLLCRLSGIATATAALVDAVRPHGHARIVCTRKTTPGCARWRSTPCGPAVEPTIASGSTMPF